MKPLEVRETHDGRCVVVIATDDGVERHRILTRDEALLLAFEIIVASSPLSRDEVAKRFAASNSMGKL